jgi:hypothetical protein
MTDQHHPVQGQGVEPGVEVARVVVETAVDGRLA